MTRSELDTYKKIDQRIKELEEEIYSLFEAQGKEINPVKRIIKAFSRTKAKDYPHECQIKLSLEDIRLLQDARLRELNTLKEFIKEK